MAKKKKKKEMKTKECKKNIMVTKSWITVIYSQDIMLDDDTIRLSLFRL